VGETIGKLRQNKIAQILFILAAALLRAHKIHPSSSTAQAQTQIQNTNTKHKYTLTFEHTDKQLCLNHYLKTVLLGETINKSNLVLGIV
jgi:hypothetical protein